MANILASEHSTEKIFSLTSEVMDSSFLFSNTTWVLIRYCRLVMMLSLFRMGDRNEKESFQPMVRSLVVVLGFCIVGSHWRQGRCGKEPEHTSWRYGRYRSSQAGRTRFGKFPNIGRFRQVQPAL